MNKGFIFIILLLVASCSSHTLMKEQEMLKPDPSYQFSQPKAEYKELDEWWASFKTTGLDNLVQKAIKNNFAIQKSAAVIEQEKAALKVTKAGTQPDVSAEVEGSRSYSSTVNDGTATSKETNSFNLGLSATYTLDLWGSDGYSLSAQELTILKTVEDHRTLVSETIQSLIDTWLTIQELETRIELLNRRIENDETNVRFVAQRHKLGLSTLTEVLQARQELISSKSSLPSLVNELNSGKRQLKVLIGEYPQLEDSTADIDFSRPLPGINPGLPSELIKRRSDIRSALLSVKVADNQVGAAVAATFPQVSLTASTGTTSDELKNLTSPDYAFWSLLANLTMPILDAQGRKAEVTRQKAVLKASLLNYKNVVFEAFKEVADDLSSIETEEALIDLLKQQIQISHQTLKQTLNSYQKGLSTWSEVLDAQSSYYDAEDSLITAQKELVSLKISLIVALGENWMS